MGERLEVVRHAGGDLLLGEPLGQGDLDRAVEGQEPAVDLDERGQRVAHRQVAADHGAAETLAGDFDLLGQGDLLFPLQERNLRHLREIHADRIAAPLAHVRRRRQGLGRAAGDLAVVQMLFERFVGIGLLGNVEELRHRGLVDQIDAFFLQGDEKIVELIGIDFLVGQVFVDFVVGQISLGLALRDQFLQILVEVVHLATPFTP